ncbi:hypothetical protein B0T17DRAFT_614882 [Bombardia bombarda]|uniref:CCR4-NOT transcription complex subunit 4 n=1 Tax=Bombardia bombarda TaxID=252184 RepID=A0AA40C8F5_9PEZI|nr:hypothetical protein B0T17DRAFT_614882 [Bombardia bombarda]
MAPQDSFIDEEDEVCPLCIEEFDLSDRNFRPCPCGYQICQFCFNNIRQNMNSLCPACRRPYDDRTIQWKVVTQEEYAEFRANIQKNQKKRAAGQRQKEVQRREAEKENRKNLVGVRVVQKNLVYVTGLTPTVREDELLKTLRRPEFFGQYGTIQKISISNRKSSDGQNQSLGIYVTFEKNEDASRCIQAVNGSQNGDRVLRAQLGTTKYCSAWLRHEQCTNRQCMFLHELGDEEDSYTRQDLSSMNSINTQRPLPTAGASRSASRQQAHPSPSPHVAQPMVRSSSKDDSENGDSSALPSSANWARNPQVRSRRGSHATSGAAPSPVISNSLPVTAESAQEEALEEDIPDQETSAGPSSAAPSADSTPAESPSRTTLEKAKRSTQDTLASLLKSLNGCTLAWPKLGDDQSPDTAYPPLFDARGWEKRRAMRDNEDRSLAEEIDEPFEVREPSEGEPESSGSLALGGEPEDRDHVREGHAFDLRRTAQPPIQRGNNEGLFGPALGTGFGQTAGNLGSIGSRTITPQQPQPGFMRPQGAFVEHLPPPGISSQANLFQGQGHNRQGSRFSFATDSRDTASSTSSVLRIFYPGAPPGLKSTGTPPSMFGQQHGIGAAFGGAGKDTNDILQILNRAPRGAGNQAHDAAKPPAPSLLASLYGPQPGAFQDFGSKQKKKGKKHRHANTSSSGGSGLVDLADPSILQARMQSHHLQQQSNAGLGQQGLFGGQSQDDELLSLEEVTTSIDALVSDEPINTGIRQPPGDFESFRRSVTPSIPPGLGFPLSHPSPAISHSSLLGHNLGRQPTPVAVPITPFKPAAATSSSPLTGKKALVAPLGSEAKKNIKALAVESGLSKEIAKAKSSQKVLQDEDFPALNTPKLLSSVVTPVVAPAVPAKQPANKSSGAGAGAAGKKVNDKKLAEKQQAATEKDKLVSVPTTRITSNSTPAAAAAAAATIAKQSEPRPTVQTKPVPGILNIAAATKVAQIRNIETLSAATEKSVPDRDSAFPALPTPTTASVASPLVRVAPKTLRVVSTPKTETPPTPATGYPPIPATSSIRSAAAAASIRPETPVSVSEMISDSASIISASISASRTNSPPPAKVGSAPVRITTKSQQRKQRKEALKKDSIAVATPMTKAEPEVEIAPIIGRKKKQKKEKEKPSTTVSRNATPVVSRPATPGPSSQQAAPLVSVKEATKEPNKEESSTYRSTANETTMLTEDNNFDKGGGGRFELRSKNSDGGNGRGGGFSEPLSASTPRSLPTPASVLQDLQQAGVVPGNIDSLAFFRPTGGLNDNKLRNDVGSANTSGGGNASAAASARSSGSGSSSTMTPTKSIVTEEDQATLVAGNPVRKVIDGVRILLTPNGDCIRNLSREEEDRFLELQKRVADAAANSPAAFVSSRHEAGAGAGGFSLIKGRAVPNGPPGYFPPGPGAYPSDPVNKIQREEAIYYINQYVLPRLNLNARDMSFPKAMSAWGPGGTGDGGKGGGSGGGGGANLSPHDADTAAPELSYPGPMSASGGFEGEHHHPGLASYLGMSAGNNNNNAGPPTADELSLMAASAAHQAGGSIASRAAALTLGAPGPFGNVPLMSLEDAEQALSLARKEAEKLEKSFSQFVKKNRRLLMGSGGGGGGGGH